MTELIAECLTVKGDPCVFPFSYQGEVYDACTREDSDNGAAWCAVQVSVRFLSTGGTSSGTAFCLSLGIILEIVLRYFPLHARSFAGHTVRACSVT